MQVVLRDTGDLKRLSRALGKTAEGRQLRRELTRGFRDVLRPYVPRERAAYLAAPSQERRPARWRGVPLRVLLAKSVRIEVRTTGRLAGARIRADGRRMPDGFKALPAYWEGTKPRWRHPVFGDRDTWVDQRPHPLFYRTLRPTEHAARQQVGVILAHLAARLERAT
jgi:hypothetical protein